MRLLLLAALIAAVTVPARATTVRIHYDSGQQPMLIHTARAMVAARPGPGKVWSYTWPDSAGDIDLQPALAGKGLSTGGRYRISAGTTSNIYPFFGAATGRVTLQAPLASPQLGNSRRLRIYLPPSYAENTAKRYPVLYMHDGQNLFDAASAAYGVEWGIDETVDRLVGAGVMDEIIVVGIDNTPERIAEYTPCCDPKAGGGQVAQYQAFITDTVKPHVDATLRTLPGREHTAIMGSSLGGIASLVIAHGRPDVFSMAGGVSSSLWWNEMALVRQPYPRAALKVYLDSGAISDGLEQTAAMRDAMLGLGYRDGHDLLYHADPAGRHNEASWAARVHRPLAWFFPWGSTRQQGKR
ncbi:alpha/beta hydrolase [Massilia sp. PAMC28688]|uniref:alpha/beta hydrolase n=1 Tax=Massilia sp. PAMC28688 TaxID=2861283 RepID=UPI001C62F61D|nr:alpha/beta hydrolase-fold protein [Massilia sp. PAMC28688]QYF91847.1 alpha/beta hydrolase [Massilia sp. PAMC28688]